LESDNAANHNARLRVSGLAPGSYAVLSGNFTAATLEIKDGQESLVELPLAAGTRSNSFTIARRLSPNR